jgi:hypothetical protein
MPEAWDMLILNDIEEAYKLCRFPLSEWVVSIAPLTPSFSCYVSSCFVSFFS